MNKFQYADTLEGLTSQLQEYCNKNSLQHISADELLSELLAQQDSLPMHIEWMHDFITAWEACSPCYTTAA